MTLRDQILARIDETPHRPPTSRDIHQACPGVHWTAIAFVLSRLCNTREIDTENGTDGLTYVKAKPAYVEPAREPAKPLYANLEGVTQWPKKVSTKIIDTPADCYAKQQVQIERSKEKFRKILTKPMTAQEYAAAANSNLSAVRNHISRYVANGFLAKTKERPCRYKVK